MKKIIQFIKLKYKSYLRNKKLILLKPLRNLYYFYELILVLNYRFINKKMTYWLQRFNQNKKAIYTKKTMI